MTANFKIRIEWIIILILIIMLLFDGCNGKEPCATVTTTVTQKPIQIKDSVSLDHKEMNPPEKVQVIKTATGVELVEKGSKLPEITRNQVIPALRYNDTTYFSHGKLFSSILSEGKILKTSFETDFKFTETTITKEKIKPVSGLFISPSFSVSRNYGVETIDLSLTYIYQGKFGISAGVYQNLITNNQGLKFAFHKKIFN
jgi:hypothetical protein